MRVPQPLLAGILGMKLPSFPTKGQLVFCKDIFCKSLQGFAMITNSNICIDYSILYYRLAKVYCSKHKIEYIELDVV